MNKDVLIIHVPNITYRQCEKDKDIFRNGSGLFSICNELNLNNIKAEIINLAVEYEINKNFSITEYIKNLNIKIIGFSLHWFTQIYDTLRIAKEIKQQFSDITIIFGGYSASCFSDVIIKKYDFVDYVIKGEGEVPFLQLCQHILGKKKTDKNKIPNLVYKNIDKVVENKNKWCASSKELNNFDFTNVTLMKNYEYYIYNFNLPFYITTVRGCSGNCSCCGGGAKIAKKMYNRQKISIRKSDIVVNEIIKLYKLYNISSFHIMLDNSFKQENLVIKIIEIIGNQFFKKFHFTIECYKLPGRKLIDKIHQYLNNDSIILISPVFAQEKLRKLHKSFYFSNNDFIKILNYISLKEVNTIIYFNSILDCNIYEKINKLNIIKYLNSQYKNILISNLPESFDPYSPITINPNKYDMNQLETINFDFDYYLNYWKNNNHY